MHNFGVCASSVLEYVGITAEDVHTIGNKFPLRFVVDKSINFFYFDLVVET